MSQGWQTPGWQSPYGARTVDRAAYDAGLRSYMLRIFSYMAGGLAVTGLVALAVASSPALIAAIFGTPLKWVAMLAPIAMVFLFAGMIHRMSAATAQLVFWAYAALMGVSMASIFLVFTGQSIAKVFFISASVFLAAALYGYTTKKDLTSMGSFLFMGVIGIVIAGLVNIFLASSMMSMIISMVAVVLFTGLTAFDAQRLKEEYAEGYGHEGVTKMALLGALSLYLNFINIFTSLLNLMGDRE